MCENCVFSSSGQFLDIFSTFFGHFVDIPFFWAVQRFARYNSNNSKNTHFSDFWGHSSQYHSNKNLSRLKEILEAINSA